MEVTKRILKDYGFVNSLPKPIDGKLNRQIEIKKMEVLVDSENLEFNVASNFFNGELEKRDNIRNTLFIA